MNNLDLKVGDEFNSLIINGVEHQICKKYKIEYQRTPNTKSSKYNKKLNRFDKLVPNQFRFHEDTSALAKNLHLFNSDDIIVITDKWHGISAVFSNVLVNKELNWYEKLLKKFGINIVDKEYSNLYSSRSIIKNRYINKEVTEGYYREDIWGTVNKELKDKIEQGIIVYGEIVGNLASGACVQKNYDYGCSDKEHKFVVYRITYTKPDGNTIEFSWQQIKDYCQKYSLETVKELYFGKLDFFPNVIPLSLLADMNWRESFLIAMSKEYLERQCKYCVNKVPAEGICVRIDGKQSYMTYKLKSKAFLLKETKDLDKGEINIEEIS